MHQVWDFTEDLGRLTELEHAQLTYALQTHTVQPLSGTITAVGPDTFTICEDDGRSSTWPVQGWMSGYRRGLRCHVVLGPDEVIGVGESAHLRYVTVPEMAEVWVESRGRAL